MMGGEPSQPPCLGGRRRRRRRSLLPHALLLGIVGTLMLAVLASTADAWRLPSFAHRRPAPQLQLQQQRPKTQLLWAAGPSTQEPPPATDKKEGGGDGNAKQQQGAGGDDGPMDAGKLLELLRALVVRPFEGEWEAWRQQEQEVARALKAELQGQQAEMEENVGQEEEEGEEEASASEMSMRVLSTLEELQPEVRRVLEEAIAAVRAQEAEARDKVSAELSELRAQQKQYMAEREEELEVVEGYADQIKDLTRAAMNKEAEVQQLRRNLKEIQNIRRDLAYRLEQSQKAADGAVAESRQQIEELQRQLGREQAALKELQTREATLTQERDRARSEAKALVSALAKESGSMAAEGAQELEAKLQALVDAVGVGEEYERALADGGFEGVMGGGSREGVELWNKWYAEAFGELEGRMAAVGAAADAAVARMRGEVEGMRREVEAADARVRDARAEAAGALKDRDQAQKRAAKADLERESVEENARLLQSLYDEETARFEAAMYKMMRRLKEEEGAAAKVAEAGRVEREQLQREYEAKLKERERALAAATEGREGLQRRLDAELEDKATALAALDAQLQAEQEARAAAQTRLARFEEQAAARVARFEERTQALEASVQRLKEEKAGAARDYEAKLEGERGERAREAGEWQRRVDRVRTQEMAAVADMQAAQQETQRISRELEGVQTSLSTYEEERTSVRALLRLLVRVVVDRVRNRRRHRGRRVGEAATQGGLLVGEGAEGGRGFERARGYARRTEAREQTLELGGELGRLLAPVEEGEGEGESG